MIETNHEDEQRVRERLVALTKDLILIPSTASRPDDIERCIAFVRNYIKALDDVKVMEYRHNKIPSLVALPKKIGKPEVLLVSHLDVVSHEDVEVYNPEIADGRIE